MSTRSIAHRFARMRRASYRWFLILAIGFALAALAALAYRPASPATSAAPGARGHLAADPAVQSVLAYLRAHPGAQPTWAAPHQDAAQQAIMSYVRAHESVPTPTATGLDAVTNAVLDYLRAHSR